MKTRRVGVAVRPMAETGSRVCRSEAQTHALAKGFAARLGVGDILGLTGPLGAGKTSFIKGLCAAWNISKDEVLSPTFTLMHIYEGRPSGTLPDVGQMLPVYHFDAYRLNSIKEFQDLGYEDQFFGRGISVVEWADKVKPCMPSGTWWIRFEVQGPNTRKISWKRKARR